MGTASSICLTHEHNYFSHSVNTKPWVSYTRYMEWNKSKHLDSYPATNAQLHMNDIKSHRNGDCNEYNLVRTRLPQSNLYWHFLLHKQMGT
jgi:hypothetical protein